MNPYTVTINGTEENITFTGINPIALKNVFTALSDERVISLGTRKDACRDHLGYMPSPYDEIIRDWIKRQKPKYEHPPVEPLGSNIGVSFGSLYKHEHGLYEQNLLKLHLQKLI
jgi:hypothetical protein